MGEKDQCPQLMETCTGALKSQGGKENHPQSLLRNLRTAVLHKAGSTKGQGGGSPSWRPAVGSPSQDCEGGPWPLAEGQPVRSHPHLGADCVWRKENRLLITQSHAWPPGRGFAGSICQEVPLTGFHRSIVG